MENELYHWFKLKHKYIAKVKRSDGTYRYFYDQDEYKAYLKGQKKQTAVSISSNVSKLVARFANMKTSTIKIGMSNDAIDELKESTSKLMWTLSAKLESTLIKIKRNFTNRITSTELKDHKYIAKVKLANGEYRYFYDQDEYDAYLKRQEYQENEPEYMKELPEIDEPKTFEDDVVEINEKYSIFDASYSLNCMLCTTAYELRRRGYDVEAAPVTEETTEAYTKKREELGLSSDYKNDAVAYASVIYKNPVINEVPSEKISDLAAYLKENTEPNTRGNLMYKYGDTNTGHSIIYETDSKGNVKLIDSQIAAVTDSHGIMSTDSEINEYAESRMGAVYFMRTDNLEFTEEGVNISVRDN